MNVKKFPRQYVKCETPVSIKMHEISIFSHNIDDFLFCHAIMSHCCTTNTEKHEERNERNTREKQGRVLLTVGVILAAAGSAIGIGNVWRFSYVVIKTVAVRLF